MPRHKLVKNVKNFSLHTQPVQFICHGSNLSIYFNAASTLVINTALNSDDKLLVNKNATILLPTANHTNEKMYLAIFVSIFRALIDSKHARYNADRRSKSESVHRHK